MVKNKIGIGVLVLATLQVGMELIPAASAQKEGNYSVTAEKTLGSSIYDVVFYPEPYKVAEALKTIDHSSV